MCSNQYKTQNTDLKPRPHDKLIMSSGTVQTSNFAEDDKDIKMDTVERKRLRSNYTDLLARLKPQDVTDFLRQKQVLTIKDIESIQAFTLIAILRCEGKNGFTLFLEALNRNGYEELANKIENTFVVLTPRDEHVTKSTPDEHVTDFLRGKHGTEISHDKHETESHTEKGESDDRIKEVKEELREKTELVRRMRVEIERVRLTFS